MVKIKPTIFRLKEKYSGLHFYYELKIPMRHSLCASFFLANIYRLLLSSWRLKSIFSCRHLRGRCRWKRRKGTKITTTFCIAFLSPIVKISHTLDFATSSLFCRFATFPPLQRRNLPPKEEASGVCYNLPRDKCNCDSNITLQCKI